MYNSIYENTTQIASPRGSPVPQYDYRRAVHRDYVRPGVPCSPPEAAWKSYEMQELYDELSKLRRRDETHAKWRHEVEKKWKESQEEVRELKGEIKLLKEENSLLLSKAYAPRVTNPVPVHSVFLDQEFKLHSRVRCKNFAPIYRPQTEIESQKMKDDIKSLNLVIQQLNEDKTDLIQELTKAEEGSKQLEDYGRRQEAKIQEHIQRNQQISIKLAQLNCKFLNCQNENANLTMIVKENLAGIK